MRGATLAEIDGAPIYKNTIMSDGVIKNFSMKSAADNLTIRAYESVARASAISAKIAENASISGGAQLSLEAGARVEVLDGVSLAVERDSSISIETDLSDSTRLSLGENSTLTFGDGAILTIDLIGDFDPNATYTFALIDWVESSVVNGLDKLVKDSSLLLKMNGKDYAGNWDAVVGNSSLNIVIPEPATYATLLGSLAVALAFMRRRR